MQRGQSDLIVWPQLMGLANDPHANADMSESVQQHYCQHTKQCMTKKKKRNTSDVIIRHEGHACLHCTLPAAECIIYRTSPHMNTTWRLNIGAEEKG